jgi:hypothetical protein
LRLPSRVAALAFVPQTCHQSSTRRRADDRPRDACGNSVLLFRGLRRILSPKASSRGDQDNCPSLGCTPVWQSAPKPLRRQVSRDTRYGLPSAGRTPRRCPRVDRRWSSVPPVSPIHHANGKLEVASRKL